MSGNSPACWPGGAPSARCLHSKADAVVPRCCHSNTLNILPSGACSRRWCSLLPACRCSCSVRTTEVARRIANAEEVKAQLCVRLQKELRMKPHEAVASAKAILSRPEASSTDFAVGGLCRCCTLLPRLENQPEVLPTVVMHLYLCPVPLATSRIYDRTRVFC